MEQSEQELLQAYKTSGRLEVLGTLYEPYMDLVYGVCLKFFENAEDAKDAVINIFEELVQKLMRHEVVNFKSWLYQVAKNHCLMKIRSDKKFGKKMSADVVQLTENFHLESVFEKENLLNGLEECLEQLPREQNRAVTLFYLEGKSYKEIADSTGLEAGKVRSHIQNGRRNLKICIENKTTESVIK